MGAEWWLWGPIKYRACLCSDGLWVIWVSIILSLEFSGLLRSIRLIFIATTLYTHWFTWKPSTPPTFYPSHPSSTSCPLQRPCGLQASFHTSVYLHTVVRIIYSYQAVWLIKDGLWIHCTTPGGGGTQLLCEHMDTAMSEQYPHTFKQFTELWGPWDTDKTHAKHSNNGHGGAAVIPSY